MAFRESSGGARRQGGKYEAIFELLPKGQSGTPVKAWTFTVTEVIFARK